MATYTVKLGTNEGALSTRQVVGNNADEVRRRLTAEGYFVFSVKTSLNPLKMLSRRKVPQKKFLMFNKELRGLVKAGLPITEGLDIIIARHEAGPLLTLIEDVRDKLRGGESLSEAFSHYSGLIPSYYPALLRAGEASGNLDEVLLRFIQQEERLRRTRKRFTQSLTYPAILMFAGMISVYIILTKAMPQFSAMYTNSGQELPMITNVVMGLSEWMVDWWMLVLGGIVFFVISLYIYAQTQNGACLLEKILRRIPTLGRMWSLQSQNIFSRTLRLLIIGGITLPEAIEILSSAVPSPNLRLELAEVHKNLLQGESLHNALENHAQLADIVHEMVRIGEETGTLDQMLDYLSEDGEEEAEDTLEFISNMIAPIILLFVGILIAIMVVAMYLPMFGSYDMI